MGWFSTSIIVPFSWAETVTEVMKKNNRKRIWLSIVVVLLKNDLDGVLLQKN
tara:strand:- start:304 stop:459 length:156 start_codon:yes stop_codon:yes gene_type:complete